MQQVKDGSHSGRSGMAERSARSRELLQKLQDDVLDAKQAGPHSVPEVVSAFHGEESVGYQMMRRRQRENAGS
jgi:hypothetical protein